MQIVYNKSLNQDTKINTKLEVSKGTNTCFRIIFHCLLAHLDSGRMKRNIMILNRTNQKYILEILEAYKKMQNLKLILMQMALYCAKHSTFRKLNHK